MSKISKKVSNPTPPERTNGLSEGAAAYGGLVLEIFRINSRLNAWGDHFAAGTGLSSARWRVLGSIMPEPKQVAQIARERGLTRQSVQQIANSMVDDGLARFKDNERHKSSKLLEPTALGRKTLLQLNTRYTTFINANADDSTDADLKTAMKLLAKLTKRFDIEKSS